MADLPPALVSFLTGFISGLILSIPVGPVNLTIMNEGARSGFRWAAMIGLGAVVMELIYCTLAFTGFATFFEAGWIQHVMEFGSFFFMLYLGIKFLVTKKIPSHSDKPGRMETKLHPHSAFMIGFVRVMANIGVFAFWVVLAVSFLHHNWVQKNWPSKLVCIAGVTFGTGLWFFGLSYGVSRGHGKFTEKTLLRMQHWSGIGLLVLAAGHGTHVVWQMAHHPH